jgi:Prolyl oligopeptidase, N-terminal beta-propeller domain
VVQVRDKAVRNNTFRWLEDAASDQTRSWTMAQDRRTRSYLQNLPFYGAVRRRAEEVLRAESVTYDALRRAGSAYFALKGQAPKQQPFLVTLSDLDDRSDERVLVDPNEIDDSGSTTIDWYQPSPDGRLVAVSLSSRGTEDGTVHVYQTTSGELIGVTVPRVNGGTAGGSLAWGGGSSGFWYTRYPSPGERPEDDVEFYQEVWYHSLGDSLEDDRRELSAVFADDRIAENFLNASPDGLWVMDRVQKGDGGEWQVFVRAQTGGDWWLVADVDDRGGLRRFRSRGSVPAVPAGRSAREGPAVAAAGWSNSRTRCRGGARGGRHDRGASRDVAERRGWSGGDGHPAMAAGHGRRPVIAAAVRSRRHAGRAGRGTAELRGLRPVPAGRE